MSAPVGESARRVRSARVVGFVLGALLLAGAGAALATRTEDLRAALGAVRTAPPGWFIAAAALPLVTLVATSGAFWVLMNRHGRVRLGEMLALINAAWLLNYLPLWPGMIGRLAYHKSVNGIAVRDSAKAIIWANVLNLLGAGLTLAALAGGSLVFDGGDWRLAAIGAAPIVVIGGLAAHAARVAPKPEPGLWRLLACAAVRAVEVHIHAARYGVCFAITGSPIDWGAALALACAAALAGAVNAAPNGLGVREWVIALVAPVLPVALTGRASLDLTAGLAADLLNRGFEVLVAVPTGLVASAWVAGRVKERGANGVEAGT